MANFEHALSTIKMGGKLKEVDGTESLNITVGSHISYIQY